MTGPRVLSEAQLVERLWPSDSRPADIRSAVNRIVREGMMVGGIRVRLVATRRPSGRCFTLKDVEAFEALVDDAAGGEGRRQRPSTPPHAQSHPHSPYHSRQSRLASSASILRAGLPEREVRMFDRCADDEIGTYPTPARHAGTHVTDDTLARRGRSATSYPLAPPNG